MGLEYFFTLVPPFHAALSCRRKLINRPSQLLNLSCKRNTPTATAHHCGHHTSLVRDHHLCLHRTAQDVLEHGRRLGILGLHLGGQDLERAEHKISHKVHHFLTICGRVKGLVEVGLHGRVLDEQLAELLVDLEQVLMFRVSIRGVAEPQEVVGKVDAGRRVDVWREELLGCVRDGNFRGLIRVRCHL